MACRIHRKELALMIKKRGGKGDLSEPTGHDVSKFVALKLNEATAAVFKESNLPRRKAKSSVIDSHKESNKGSKEGTAKTPAAAAKPAEAPDDSNCQGAVSFALDDRLKEVTPSTAFIFVGASLLTDESGNKDVNKDAADDSGLQEFLAAYPRSSDDIPQEPEPKKPNNFEYKNCELNDEDSDGYEHLVNPVSSTASIQPILKSPVAKPLIKSPKTKNFEHKNCELDDEDSDDYEHLANPVSSTAITQPTSKSPVAKPLIKSPAFNIALAEEGAEKYRKLNTRSVACEEDLENVEAQKEIPENRIGEAQRETFQHEDSLEDSHSCSQRSGTNDQEYSKTRKRKSTGNGQLALPPPRLRRRLNKDEIQQKMNENEELNPFLIEQSRLHESCLIAAQVFVHIYIKMGLYKPDNYDELVSTTFNCYKRECCNFALGRKFPDSKLAREASKRKIEEMHKGDASKYKYLCGICSINCENRNRYDHHMQTLHTVAGIGLICHSPGCSWPLETKPKQFSLPTPYMSSSRTDMMSHMKEFHPKFKMCGEYDSQKFEAMDAKIAGNLTKFNSSVRDTFHPDSWIGRKLKHAKIQAGPDATESDESSAINKESKSSNRVKTICKSGNVNRKRMEAIDSQDEDSNSSYATTKSRTQILTLEGLDVHKAQKLPKKTLKNTAKGGISCETTNNYILQIPKPSNSKQPKVRLLSKARTKRTATEEKKKKQRKKCPPQSSRKCKNNGNKDTRSSNENSESAEVDSHNEEDSNSSSLGLLEV